MLWKICIVVYHLLKIFQTLLILSHQATPFLGPVQGKLGEEPISNTAREPLAQPSTSEFRSNSKAAQPSSSTRKRVIVFDFDNTLCREDLCKGKEAEFVKKNNSECPIINLSYDGCKFEYVFLPYLHILFEYLFERGVRIAFFSAEDKAKDDLRIPLFLTRLFGAQKYTSLKSKGEFDIFSIEDTREGNSSLLTDENTKDLHFSLRPEGHCVKDLRAVVRDGESLSDVVLVEDDINFTAHDQQPCLLIPCLIHWDLQVGSETAPSPYFDYNFPKNSIYYMLGVFKTYFENKKYKRLPFREALGQIIPREKYYSYESFFRKNPFVRDMIESGLSEVRKLVPKAIFYGRGDFNSSESLIV